MSTTTDYTKPEEVDTQWLADRMLQRPTTPPFEDGGVKLTIEKIPAGTPHQVVSLRNAIFMGQKPTSVAFDVPFWIRHLGYEGGEWMADSCQEIWQMHEPLERLREMDEPELLVGGLGLGVFSHLADQYAGAIVTTIERDERIIKWVAPHTARLVLRGDIYEHARQIKDDDYDAAFLDTWQRTGEYAWIREVVPLRRLLAGKIPAENIWCWNEDEMTGQVRLSGLRAMCVPLQNLPASSTHWRVLRAKAEQVGIAPTVDYSGDDRMHRVLEAADQLHRDPVAFQILEKLLRHAGSPEWEAEYGQLWDAAEAEAAEWRRENKLDD